MENRNNRTNFFCFVHNLKSPSFPIAISNCRGYLFLQRKVDTLFFVADLGTKYCRKKLLNLSVWKYIIVQLWLFSAWTYPLGYHFQMARWEYPEFLVQEQWMHSLRLPYQQLSLRTVILLLVKPQSQNGFGKYPIRFKD